MKYVLMIFILICSFQAFAQMNDGSLAEKLGQYKSQSSASVMDLADTTVTFYGQKDPMFIMSTYISLSCAAKDGQLENLAEELLRLPAKHHLIKLIESINVENKGKEKIPIEVVNEYHEKKSNRIQEFFRMSLLKLPSSEKTVECYLSRVR